MNTRIVRAAALSAAALGLIAGGARAQAVPYGTGCTGFSGIPPAINADNAPIGGSSFSVTVTGPPSPLGYLVIGVSSSVWPPFPLPLDLAFLGLPGCNLVASADNLIAFSMPLGTKSFATPSLNPSAHAFLQAFVFDPDIAFTSLGGMTAGLEVTAQAPSGANPGDLVINEFLQDPNTVFDSAGEYFEIYNATGAPIDIEGFTLADDGSDAHVIANGGLGVIVPANDYFVFGVNANPLTNGGVAVDHQWAALSYFLANTADEIVILDTNLIEIDRVNYDASFSLAVGKATSLAVAAKDALSNDTGTNWAPATCFLGGTPFNLDTGTPGQSNDQCTTGSPPAGTGELVFSEIMQNPAAVADTAGEWFEVYNTTAAAIDMDGYTISAGGSFVISGSLVVPAGGRKLFVRVGDPLMNGGLPLGGYDYPDAFNLGNASQTCQILDAASGLVSKLTYDDGATYPDPTGATMTLNPTKHTAADAALGASWCLGTSAYGLGDKGTPGTANDACP